MSAPILGNVVGNAGGGPDAGSAAIRLGFAAEPIVDLAVCGAPPLYSECLVRMMVAESVLLRGAEIVEDIEAAGSIGLLDAAVVDLVLDALAEESHVILGCNISPRTLADADAWAWVMRRIEVRSWLASRLVLEITESCLLNELDGVAERLGQAKRLGCRLAIDDFGAGFATSVYLQGVDVAWDIVKIDRLCFADLRNTPSGRVDLCSLFSLARAFAPLVVVEGIETREHFDAARAAGAQYGQGWMFEGPVRHRWATSGDDIGEHLAAAMMAHGAIVRPSGPAPTIVAPATPRRGDPPEPGGTYLLSRVDRIGDRVRALVGRAKAGGVS
ncbi:EAL domain-containing protein [Methylobacterium nodulans]|uniref:Diguanylate phosphodiesterase n=1 Tax=Methylobacterium nodulans (strain LMG 21967 / CNCM I-2342 / ORS 2060) TaxID=460265 RepID=B8IW45_METNO|nr:EAL domain-containing protein [Methylobacterium nodulans]ACL62635.1 diguanylate phosphodiesterase [Methylobacterium nodulans ORS 2060]